jgi:uncharacterized protein
MFDVLLLTVIFFVLGYYFPSVFLYAPFPVALTIYFGLITVYFLFQKIRCVKRQSWCYQRYKKGRESYDQGSYALARVFFEESACGGNIEAQNCLGAMHLLGKGVEKSYALAWRWLKLAAKQNHAKAQNSIGVMLQKGLGCEKDINAAFKYYKLSAEQGFATGQYHLGFMYLTGQGVAEDDCMAQSWFLRSAEQGFVEAQNHLGFLYYYGQGFLQENLHTESKGAGVSKSCKEGESLDFLYGDHCIEQNYHLAYEWYCRAAEKQNATAQYYVGVMNEFGQGCKKSIKQAEYWYLQAAEKGEKDAVFALEELFSDRGKVFNKKKINQYISAFECKSVLKICPHCARKIHLQIPLPTSDINCNHCLGKIKIKQSKLRLQLIAIASEENNERIIIECSHCHEKMRVPKPDKPQVLVCKHCKKRLDVQSDDQETVRVKPRQAAEKKTIDPKQWYDVLQLSPGADLGMIKHARKKLLIIYHPDKVAHLSYEERVRSEEKAKQINIAYDNLIKLLGDKV